MTAAGQPARPGCHLLPTPCVNKALPPPRCPGPGGAAGPGQAVRGRVNPDSRPPVPNTPSAARAGRRGAAPAQQPLRRTQPHAKPKVRWEGEAGATPSPATPGAAPHPSAAASRDGPVPRPPHRVAAPSPSLTGPPVSARPARRSRRRALTMPRTGRRSVASPAGAPAAGAGGRRPGRAGAVAGARAAPAAGGAGAAAQPARPRPPFLLPFPLPPPLHMLAPPGARGRCGHARPPRACARARARAVGPGRGARRPSGCGR